MHCYHAHVNINQTIYRLSDRIRYAIENSEDRLMAILWVVVTSLYVKRCQDFGNYARDCQGSMCCGICSAADCETRNCIHKDKPAVCNNSCVV